jgi:hypothetical protein
MGGGSGGGSAEDSGSAFNYTPMNLNIQKPDGVGSGLDTPSEKFIFDSPLSVLETMRNVSNIIVGSTRSFATLGDITDPNKNSLLTGQPGEHLTQLTPIPEQEEDETTDIEKNRWNI